MLGCSCLQEREILGEIGFFGRGDPDDSDGLNSPSRLVRADRNGRSFPIQRVTEVGDQGSEGVLAHQEAQSLP